MEQTIIHAATNINFPKLGIELKNVPVSFNVFGIEIALYGVCIMIGMLLAIKLAEVIAKRSGQDQDFYIDFAIYAIVISVICARIYYVIFAWDEFKDSPLSVFNLRTGGLAIYGGVIGAALTGIIYCKIKKYPFFRLADTGVPCLLLGQIIGRWGNFFNREAFGKFTDGVFAMQVALRDVSYDYSCSLSVLAGKYAGRTAAYNSIVEIRENMLSIDGVSYIQVHPTFLYESLWNLVLLIILLVYWKHKKFEGEIMFMYFAGYGLGRVWIEGLRTDQLFLWGLPVPVSQLLSVLLFVAATIAIIVKRMKLWLVERAQEKNNTSDTK